MSHLFKKEKNSKPSNYTKIGIQKRAIDETPAIAVK
jgi:hypothetical protein